MSEINETPEETIERLLKSNNRLAQMVKASSDRLQEGARELLAQGWERAMSDLIHDDGSPVEIVAYQNPYRQPINLPGATE